MLTPRGISIHYTNQKAKILACLSGAIGVGLCAQHGMYVQRRTDHDIAQAGRDMAYDCATGVDDMAAAAASGASLIVVVWRQVKHALRCRHSAGKLICDPAHLYLPDHIIGQVVLHDAVWDDRHGHIGEVNARRGTVEETIVEVADELIVEDAVGVIVRVLVCRLKVIAQHCAHMQAIARAYDGAALWCLAVGLGNDDDLACCEPGEPCRCIGRIKVVIYTYEARTAYAAELMLFAGVGVVWHQSSAGRWIV